MVDSEALARWVYARTSCSLASPPGPLFLLRSLIGDERITFRDGAEASVDDRSGMVSLPRGLSPQRFCLACALVDAHVAAWMLHWSITKQEGHEVAIAVIMPREAVLAAVQSCGPNAEALASIFVIDARLASHRLRRLGLRLRSGQYARPIARSAG